MSFSTNDKSAADIHNSTVIDHFLNISLMGEFALRQNAQILALDTPSHQLLLAFLGYLPFLCEIVQQ